MTSPAWITGCLTALLDGDGNDDAFAGRALTDGMPAGLGLVLGLPFADPGLAAQAEALLADPELRAPDAAAMAATLLLLRCGFAGTGTPGWLAVATRSLSQQQDPRLRGLLMLAIALHERDAMACGEYADLVIAGIAILPESAGVRGVHLHQAAMFLALRGSLRLLDGHLALPSPGDAEPEVPEPLLAECFYDAVINGRVPQARHLLARCRASAADLSWQNDLISIHAGYLDCFAAILEDRPLPPPRVVPSGPILHALAVHDEAFLGAYVPRTEAPGLPILAHDDIRVALAVRDSRTAREIIDGWQAQPGRHPVDDLFVARLLLLEDRGTAVQDTLSRLVTAIDSFDAWGRVEIELRLARELTRCDLLRTGFRRDPVDRTPAPAALIAAGPGPHAMRVRECLARLEAVPGVVLLTGPSDGSRPALAREIHARYGRGALAVISFALDSGAAVLERVRSRPSGTLVIDDLDLASEGDVAALGLILDQGGAATQGLIVLAGPAGIRDRPGRIAALAWTADARIALPSWEERSSDVPDILAGLVAVALPQVRWTGAARQRLVARTWRSWPEIRSWARAIARRSPVIVDPMLLDRIAADLGDGDTQR
ncbi:MAG: hypothetical protein RLZZ127_2965 [Planctomycetota bacterium]|jgi:hypothetical protein